MLQGEGTRGCHPGAEPDVAVACGSLLVRVVDLGDFVCREQVWPVGGMETDRNAANAVEVALLAAVDARDFIAPLHDESIDAVGVLPVAVNVNPAKAASLALFVDDDVLHAGLDLSVVADVAEAPCGGSALGNVAAPQVFIVCGVVGSIGGVAGALAEDDQAVLGSLSVAVDVSVGGDVHAGDGGDFIGSADGLVEGKGHILAFVKGLDLRGDDCGGALVDQVGLAAHEGLSVCGDVVDADEAVSVAHVDMEEAGLKGADADRRQGGATDGTVGALDALVAGGDADAEVVDVHIAAGGDLEGQFAASGEEVIAVTGDCGDDARGDDGPLGLVGDCGPHGDGGHVVDILAVGGAVDIVVEEFGLHGEGGVRQRPQGLDVNENSVAFGGV